MRTSPKLLLVALGSLAATSASHAQLTSNWASAAVTGNWSSTANWSANGVPNNNGDTAQIGTNLSRDITVDQDFTIKALAITHNVSTSVPGTTTALSGSGILTVDINTASSGVAGFTVASANSNATLRIDGAVTINNAANPTVRTYITNLTASNSVVFSPSSTLTLTTGLHANGPGASRFNGTILGANDLTIGTATASFGTGHVSSSFGGNVNLVAVGSKLTIDAGTVLSPGKKFQINADNNILELNGANTVNGANISVAGTNNFLLDVNASQTSMGVLADIGGTLTINLDPSIASLWFLDSSASASNWTGGSVTIAGFREGVVRFGTSTSALTADQLLAIDGGIYSLTETGYLTAIPEPAFFAGIAGLGVLGMARLRRRRA